MTPNTQTIHSTQDISEDSRKQLLDAHVFKKTLEFLLSNFRNQISSALPAHWKGLNEVIITEKSEQFEEFHNKLFRSDKRLALTISALYNGTLSCARWDLMTLFQDTKDPTKNQELCQLIVLITISWNDKDEFLDRLNRWESEEDYPNGIYDQIRAVLKNIWNVEQGLQSEVLK